MSALYDTAREAFLSGDLSWTTSTVRAVLVDTASYTFDPSHTGLADVPAGARVATSPAFVGKTATAGVADAEDVSFPTVTGPEAEALVIYAESGPLIAYIDAAAGLPVTPNGGNVNVTWDDGPNRIFRL